MAAAHYAAKTAYRGDIVTHYDDDRMSEALWEEEQAFVRTWLGGLPAGTTVLDVPVGTGRFLPLLAERGLAIIGRDVSADMVAEARRRYGHQAAHLAVGDAEKLDLPDQAVDAVICWCFFHLVPRPVLNRVLAEFYRVCRGPVLVQVLQVKLPGPADGLWAAVKNRLRPWYRRLRPVQIDQPWGHITSYQHRERELLAAFQTAGFRVKQTVRMKDSGGWPVLAYTLER